MLKIFSTVLATTFSLYGLFELAPSAQAQFPGQTRNVADIANFDPIYPVNGNRYRSFNLPVQAGRTYVIELNRLPGQTIDPYLYLEDANFNILAHDDDSGGNLNARIVYTATRTEQLTIIVTSFSGGTGAMNLTVTSR